MRDLLQIGLALQVLPPHTRLTVPRAAVEVPPERLPQVARSVGAPRGQRADWRLALSCGRGLHIVEFTDRYELHIDAADPSRGVLRHNALDCPPALAGLLAAAGFGAAAALGLPGALIGAGLGALAASLTSALLRRQHGRVGAHNTGDLP
jgi:hypothetical protein